VTIGLHGQSTLALKRSLVLLSVVFAIQICFIPMMMTQLIWPSVFKVHLHTQS